MVPVQYAGGPGPAGVEAIGIMTEGEAIVIRSPLETQNRESSAGVHVEEAPSPAARQTARQRTPLAGEERVSTFAAVLDSIEQAIETAAVAVETMAGGVTSPRDLNPESGSRSD